MKIKKKTALFTSFTIGTLLFATTALADIASKSGYDQLKDALKKSSASASEKFDSFTLDISYALKDNGKIISSQNEVTKFDRTKQATEHLNSSENINGNNYKNHYYSDSNTSIHYPTDNNDTYQVIKFAEPQINRTFDDPFKARGAEDIEKIADAIVGSLKDYVAVKDSPDGTKELSGSLSEVQIPPLVNAAASFQMKQMFAGGRDQMPRLSKDIFVKEVTGHSLINKDGVIENILGTAIISGKDEQGEIHTLTFEVLGKLTDINATVVTKPDLTGKKVEQQVVANGYSGPQMSNPEKFIGQYKNNIIIVKDGKFVKIGERIIDITHIDNDTVSGRYHEEFKTGYPEYAQKQQDLKFDAKFEGKGNNANFECTDQAGKKFTANIYLDEFLGRVMFNIDSPNMNGLTFDSQFMPVLE